MVQDHRGQEATAPSHIPARGWFDISNRLWRAIGEDRIFLVAGGATFYLLLALFPALTAFVSAYGFFADPAAATGHVDALGSLVPSDVLGVVSERLESLVTQDQSALGLGMILGILIALWSANNGIKALFEGLNIAYRERETRSFVRLNLIAMCFTLGAMVAASLLIAAIGIVPVVLAVLHLGSWSELLLSSLRWPVLLVLIGAGITLIYRYGPSREPAKWRWLTWGSAGATVVWVMASAAFSFYLERFADYEATYGSLGAIIGFLMWTWISVIILLLGAEFNAEMELQTSVDSTTGPSRPMGSRGAVVADTPTPPRN
ncbi:YihY/virulence factor BrkB family protein [Mesorhizobium sp. CAU 1741]|uniref:YihY/virulence factor BrkB family protein n=1 Tax=Mesorhizobium sp. CAU 1741 TaxID=3140366 RepID=UPI00325A512F